MRRLIRNLRDHPLILGSLVAALRTVRKCGLRVSPAVYKHVPYRGLVCVDCGNGRYFRIHSRGNKTENGLFWEGLLGHEPESVRRWIRYTSRARCVLDVGANVGVYSLIAAATGSAAIHAFEPVQRVRQILQSNVDVNNFNGITIWGHCVGSHSGQVTLYDPGGEAPVSASASPVFAQEKLSASTLRPTLVEMISVDDFCAQQRVTSVDAIKIDVEGFEMSVLEGMRQTIARFRPTILMEVLEPVGKQMLGVLGELERFGYSIERIREGEGHPDYNLLLTFTHPSLPDRK